MMSHMMSSHPNGAINVFVIEPRVGGGDGVRALAIAGRRYEGSLVGEIGEVGPGAIVQVCD
jgi:hypothetical protein